ncbi:pyruvate decarboxylase [Nannizzia gypsea CBS 118893]|uniref:Pyruvate decarboxylase n=1 Tax=Arthroderma gypseum (strain ATCC MYA-4604 / CBS 118893) TaxID=535722 RepID=E5R2I0_ARTGP|nr:pyruvate decarboxylase [Nannizzia gypsea CBS 118893]EFQ97856.1 pyruvate decarboxylase [Nannizzia gypsea CBS 118893]
MSTIPVGEYIFRRLHQLGIRNIVGVPGDFNLNLLDHVYSVPDLRWVGTCNELNAAYAADGYARARSLPGVVVTTYGVGELSALNGIVGAYSEYIPVIHIVGNTSRDMQRNHTRIHHTLWMDQWDHRTYQKMVEPVAAATAFLDDESKVAAEVDRVIETSIKRRLPVYLFVPLDIQDSPIDASPLEKPLDLAVRNEGREAEEDEVVEEVIKRMGQAKDPGVLVDMLMSRHNLYKETSELIKLLAAPWYTTPLGKSTMNESDPHFAGLYCGITSSNPALKAQIESHDAVLHLGPFNVSGNTGGFSTALPADKLIELHPGFCSVAGKVWKGLDFRPVITKLLARLTKEPIQRTVDLAKILPKTSEKPSDDNCTDPLDHARFWDRLSKFLRPNDFVIAEVGTSQFGSQGLTLPDNTTYFSQLYYSCIGFSVPATLGVLLARRETANPGRVILLVGDGSLHMTVQEIGTMVREGFKPIIIVVNNKGYTIERLIHGPEQQYNDISEMWDYQKMLGFFGAKDSRSYAARTYKELGAILNDETFLKTDVIQVVEIFFDIMDSPWNLTDLLKLKEERLAKARAEKEKAAALAAGSATAN